MLLRLLIFSLSIPVRISFSSLHDAYSLAFIHPISFDVNECLYIRANVGDRDKFYLIASNADVVLEVNYDSLDGRYYPYAMVNGEWALYPEYCNSFPRAVFQDEDFFVIDDGQRWTVFGHNWTCTFSQETRRATDVVEVKFFNDNPIILIAKCCQKPKSRDSYQ